MQNYPHLRTIATFMMRFQNQVPIFIRFGLADIVRNSVSSLGSSNPSPMYRPVARMRRSSDAGTLTAVALAVHVASEEAGFINGTLLKIDGGITA